jgi:hypothetical protein
VTGSTAASPLPDADAEADAEGDGAFDDDTGPEWACAFTYTVPAAVTPTTATVARAMWSSGRRPEGRARWLRRAALEDSMSAMVGVPTVRNVRRKLDVCQRCLRNV